MKAVVLTQDNGENKLVFTDVEDAPAPGTNEIRIKIHASGLNHLDLWVRQGLPGLEIEYPFIMGSDGAGTVVETGTDVGDFKTGGRVLIFPATYCGECEFCRRGEQSQCVSFGLLGETTDGVQREYVTLNRSHVYRVPEHLTLIEASAVPVSYVTAYRMLFSRSDLRPGDSVLIHGAGSGVSVACLQLAKLAGFEVFVTSHDDSKLDVAEKLGADDGFNYDTVDIADAVQSKTNKRGVDVVVDHVGKATWQTSIQCLRKGGTIVTCGATTGPNPETDLQRIFWNQLNIHGSTMGTPDEFESLLQTLAQHQLSPYIDRQFKAGEIAEAHQYIEDKKQMGKVVVTFPE